MCRRMKYLLCLIVFAVIANLGCGLNFSSNAGSDQTVSNSTSNSEQQEPAAGPPAAAGGESQAAGAAELVADLYKQHDAKKSPFFQAKSRALVDKYFTKRLADPIWKDATDSQGEVGAIDADPLYYAQDIQIKNFAVGPAEVKGDTTTVPVTFTNYGQKQAFTFVLVRVGDAWKIDDIKYSANDSLRKWLAEFEKPVTEIPSGVFEGVYQVGDTTCTVTPARGGFEVRWAKGSGVEMFFMTSPTDFAASPDDDPDANRFQFKNEKLDAGTFYRSDGKTYSVKRAR